MKLLISDQTTIKEINREFSKAFPFLRLDFFKKMHNPGESNLPENRLPDHTRLADIAGQVKARVIEIRASDSVAELEKRFLEDFSLPVQVSRKSGEIWIITSQTDKLTLEKQNAMGETSTRPAGFNIHTLFL